MEKGVDWVQTQYEKPALPTCQPALSPCIDMSFAPEMLVPCVKARFGPLGPSVNVQLEHPMDTD
jgi:hypothetical protein